MPVRIVSAEDPANLAEAADRLRRGLLVAFPTETVYGLGANALDADAVAQIFAVKGRPSTNPVIVHVADITAAKQLAKDWPPAAESLATAFWPGPLTLVVEKAPDAAVPDSVTAGGPTVGLRAPDHPVALELLRLAGVPVAAPSANRSEEVSPTTAQHVADSLGAWTDDLLILDGGPCRVGIESTVVDATTAPPRVLRPGMVTAEQIAAVAGAGNAPAYDTSSGPARSPGQMLRHYAPRHPVVLTSTADLAGTLTTDDAALLLGPEEWRHIPPTDEFLQQMWATKGIDWREAPGEWEVMGTTPEEFARSLYYRLRAMDEVGAARIVIELPPLTPEWAALHDRLRRAEAPRMALSPVPSPAAGEGSLSQDSSLAAPDSLLELQAQQSPTDDKNDSRNRHPSPAAGEGTGERALPGRGQEDQTP